MSLLIEEPAWVPSEVLPRVLPLALSSPISEDDWAEAEAYLKPRTAAIGPFSQTQASLPFLVGEFGARRALRELSGSSELWDVLWFLRGGVGAYRFIDEIPWERLKADLPVVIGYSDVSPLLIKMAVESKLITIHGPMLVSDTLKGHLQDMEQLWQGLYEVDMSGEWRHGARDLEAPLLAANLTSLAAWTPRLAPPDLPFILALEDIDEPAYRLHRALWTLVQAGWMHQAEAVVLGEFTRCDKASNGMTAADVLAYECDRYGIPVMSGLPFGHDPNGGKPLYVGMTATVTQSGRLRQVPGVL